MIKVDKKLMGFNCGDKIIRVKLTPPTNEETEDFYNNLNDFGNWESFNFSYVTNEKEESLKNDVFKIVSKDRKLSIRVECINGVLSIVNHYGDFILNKFGELEINENE